MPEKLLTNREGSDASSTACIYTAISFAPVQGFIEKSRKLRDLYGASQILSYLSWKIVCAANSKNCEVISPAIAEDDCTNVASVDIVQGMPNRILIKGDFSCNDAQKALMVGWKEIIEACRKWLGDNLGIDDSNSSWANSWTRWKIHAWEVFWGGGDSIESAMRDLETRKLRRGWTVPNWNGESSSLSGHDAIAYPNMDRQITPDNKRNEGLEKKEIDNFYVKLANALENSKNEDEPKFLDPSEKLSIPELIKRLVTHHQVVKDLPKFPRTKRFSELLRKEDDDEKAKRGYWTGWFMGDGDKVGDHLKSLTEAQDVSNFSQALRTWGKQFQDGFHRERLGRVVYAGGDDFLGVMYGIRNGTEEEKQRKGTEAIDWLIAMHQDWQSSNLEINLSVGFVWAGHSVPQRDVLQHCREAEKLAKSLGRDRVTIRVLFNNGQFVQWTTPWEYLKWLKDYRDRNDNTGKDANWSHVYTDLAQLKARHAIPPATAETANDAIALNLFGLYFGEDNREILSQQRGQITGSEDPKSMIEWIDGMIKVGWQLCSNS
ncbi:GGDEF domain-containing protein [Tumidithrix helvetica PCC 7403]|uniref:Cas10/Cmr2 second palm domain-containing protein n=1 Tax=Tumidithrix helvetica TaxID=3457545 RepID=UPI003C893A8D